MSLKCLKSTIYPGWPSSMLNPWTIWNGPQLSKVYDLCVMDLKYSLSLSYLECTYCKKLLNFVERTSKFNEKLIATS